MESALKSLYKSHSKPSDFIPEELFKGIVDTLNSAVSGDFIEQYPQLCEMIKDNNEVFAAFKVHDQCTRMAQLLTDDSGNIKSFAQWRKEAEPIANHHNKVWLRTEYDTAVKRAKQAQQWKQFEQERDVLPNLRWVPSTAATPGADHMIFWDTVLPIDDPFWSSHKPGDRWGCQCSIEATDDPETNAPRGSVNDEPAPGLDNNPAQDGKLFSDSHPYFPDSCNTCPFNTGGVTYSPKNKVIDCASCPFFIKCIIHSGCTTDKEYGERLLISNNAHKVEIEENIRAAKALLDSFPEMIIKINPHTLRRGHSNPEYLINGLVADRKGVMDADGITDGFRRAIEQGCSVVVIDLDLHLRDRVLRTNQVAKHISWRFRDFESGTIAECYVIHKGKAVVINKSNYSREKVLQELEKIKP